LPPAHPWFPQQAQNLLFESEIFLSDPTTEEIIRQPAETDEGLCNDLIGLFMFCIGYMYLSALVYILLYLYLWLFFVL